MFFKYDLDGMSLTVKEATTSLYQFLIRLAGVVGGVWTVAGFGLRVVNRAQKVVTGKEAGKGGAWKRPSLLPNSCGGVAGSGSGGRGEVLFDYKGR